MIKHKDLAYDWESDIQPYLDTIQDVDGGFSPAKRGIVTIQDGSKVFVKIATDKSTAKWLKKEIVAYKKLTSVKYEYIPQLLAHAEDETAMALEYLEDASFENAWDKDKLHAVVMAQEALGRISDEFKGDSNFKSGDVMDLIVNWSRLLDRDSLKSVNTKLIKLGIDLGFTAEQIRSYQDIHKGWSLKEDTLIHEDIRADNFGYDPRTKTGKLIDWNWLCIGDASLDTTPLFINMYKGGFDAYKYHPEKYDKKMIVYLIGFWLISILDGNEDSSDREWNLRKAQADSLSICLELLNEK